MKSEQGQRNFGQGTMVVKILKNTAEEVVVEVVGAMVKVQENEELIGEEFPGLEGKATCRVEQPLPEDPLLAGTRAGRGDG